MIFSGQVYFPNRVRNLSFLIPDSLGFYSQIFKKRAKYVQDFNLPTCGQCYISLCFGKSLPPVRESLCSFVTLTTTPDGVIFSCLTAP